MTRPGDEGLDRFETLFRRVESDPEADKPAGCLHTSGYFLHLVRSPETGEFLAPTYATLAGQIQGAYNRHAELRNNFGESLADGHSTRMLSFLPYPGHLSPVSSFRSNLVAIIDSGALTAHPLLEGRIEQAVDFTGEGVEDLCGHGTIQAVRQVWFEPYARLLILKAFAGPGGTPTPKYLARALNFLYNYEKEIGLVFMAGGVDITRQPSAEVICELASEVVEKKGLVGNFVATNGNAGDGARWCPAEAKNVWGIAVVDKDTLQPGAGKTAGLAVPEKGKYVSFPDIEPLRMGDFYLRYARIFRKNNFADLAHDYAGRALAYPYVEDEALGLLSMLAAEARDWEKAVEIVTKRLPRHPSDATLHGELATALMSLGRDEEAAASFERAVALKTEDAEVWHNYAVFAERRGDKERAFVNFAQAAGLEPSLLFRLQAFGSRAFYGEDYDLAIRVNQMLGEMDPTFAAASYNLCICHALKGDAAGAKSHLEAYARRAASLDTSFEQFPVEVVEQALRQTDPVIRETMLAYSLDEDRRYAPQYGLVAALVGDDAAARERKLDELGEPWLSRLAWGAVSCAERLLLAGRVSHLPQLAEVSELICVRFEGKDAGLAALVRETVGRLYHRLGDFARAAACFGAAAGLWASVSVRRKEAALVARGFSEIALDAPAAALESFKEARKTSTNIAQTEDGQVVTTSLTPRIHHGQARLALRDGDLKEAREQAMAAYHGDRGGFETLLTFTELLMREGYVEEMRKALGQLLRTAYRDDKTRQSFLRLLEDHPFYNFRLDDGYTVLDYFWAHLQEYLNGEVTLVAKTNFPFERLYDAATGEYRMPFGDCDETPPADPAKALKVAVVGTGLMWKHPCLANHVADAVDFTGEGPDDLNGSSTAQALFLLNQNREAALAGQPPNPYSLLGVKVLNKEGRGSVQQFIAGLLWARAAGAFMVMTHVQTSRRHWHLLGVVGKVAKGVMFVTTAPDEGEGRVFPGMVSDQIVVAAD